MSKWQSKFRHFAMVLFLQNFAVANLPLDKTLANSSEFTVLHYMCFLSRTYLKSVLKKLSIVK